MEASENQVQGTPVNCGSEKLYIGDVMKEVFAVHHGPELEVPSLEV